MTGFASICCGVQLCRPCLRRRRTYAFGICYSILSVLSIAIIWLLMLGGVPSSLRTPPATIHEHRADMLRRIRQTDPDDNDASPHASEQQQRGELSNLDLYALGCEAAKVYPAVVTSKALKWHQTPRAQLLPEGPIFDGRRFANCVAVSNSAALSGSRLGRFIDSHELVLRFNHAPTIGFEQDVGSRTDVRIVNDLVLLDRKYYVVPNFNFMNDALYRDLTALIGWVPREEDLWNGPIIEHYFERRRLLPHESFYMFETQGLWDIWEFLQKLVPMPIVQYTPSSGALGMFLLLHHCDVVHGVEFIPSVRFHYSYGCHYFEIYQPLPCTFFSPHPKTAEMSLWYRLNRASDEVVFGHGVTQLRGFNVTQCKGSRGMRSSPPRVDYTLLPPLGYPLSTPTS
ncbi:unnamed protein product [Notodromas monacha]|uniref:beta-galactoside alpha-(2,6)-sialyltransferase n=1 Tax=Notodromas monacha TaxID=399045 RepID=A0A7R9BIS7_9CRUS|nr:unnamed protein product [Notodromas monacha]CAG0914885.1 unnamed protein product [Notodromas monacha]